MRVQERKSKEERVRRRILKIKLYPMYTSCHLLESFLITSLSESLYRKTCSLLPFTNHRYSSWYRYRARPSSTISNQKPTIFLKVFFFSLSLSHNILNRCFSLSFLSLYLQKAIDYTLNICTRSILSILNWYVHTLNHLIKYLTNLTFNLFCIVRN